MREAHNTHEGLPSAARLRIHYIPVIERAAITARNERNRKMASSFLHRAYQRIIEARERQVSRYVNDALLSLDDKTLETIGTSRAELRRKRAASSVF